MLRTSRSKWATTKRSRTVDYVALAEFRHQLRCFLRTSEDAARNAGVEPQQHQLLLALKGAPESTRTTVAWLAERLQLNHNSVVGLLDRLETQTLIRRQRDPEDQRRVLVGMTPGGEAVLHNLSLFHQEELRSYGPALIAAIEAVVRSASPK